MYGKDKLLASVELSDGKFIHTRVVEDKTGRKFDIRNMYTDKDGEVQFTSRGVRFREEDAFEIIKPIISNLDTNTKMDMVEALTHDGEGKADRAAAVAVAIEALDYMDKDGLLELKEALETALNRE